MFEVVYNYVPIEYARKKKSDLVTSIFPKK